MYIAFYNCGIILSDIYILRHPIDQMGCVPGSRVEFSVLTNLQEARYQWFCNNQQVETNNPDYEGSTTNHLVVLECLLKHQGQYKCLISDEPKNIIITSEPAVLKLGRYII